MIARFYYFDNGELTINYYYPETKKYICNEALQNLPSHFNRSMERNEGYEYIQCPGLHYMKDWIDEHWVYEYVRNLYKHIWASTPQEKGKRIYISRNPRDVKNRAIINEDELKPVLKGLGVSYYVLENMTFIDSIKLFKSAEFVTGVHGAGLTWIIFCDPGTTVLEIYKDKDTNNHYKDISIICNLNYQRFTSIETISMEVYLCIDIPLYIETIKGLCKV